MQAVRAWVRPLRPRGPDEPHRASSPLELFVDLCFVVAVAQASTGLHHLLADGRLGQATLRYLMVFFAVWWAWMNFTWFASAYDNDDVPYRLAVLVQISGVLVLAAGVPRVFDHRDLAVIAVGYAIMRAAEVAQWLRAAHDDPAHRETNVRYAVGIGSCMAGWAALLAVHGTAQLAGFLVMAAIELLVPIWAERPAGTTWHPNHIAERYGLFTLIVLGESVASATVAVQSALDAGHALGPLLAIALGGLLVVFSMWWVYFAQPVEDVVGRARSRFEARSSRDSFTWGYGNFVLFAAAAAVGAGLAVAIEQATHDAHITARAAGLAVAVPAAIYLLCVWAFNVGPTGRGAARWVLPAGAAAVVVGTAAGFGVLGAGVLLAVTAAGVALLVAGDDTEAVDM